jgi:cell division protein ZapA (FtsZ GTPase activity inhibitor)
MEKARAMSQVSVTIDGRKYRLACNEGEEARLESLAGLIDEKIGEMRSSFGDRQRGHDDETLVADLAER